MDGSDPTNAVIVQVLFKTIEADATLIDYDDLATILAAGGGTANEECDFTNYARSILDDGDISASVTDDTNNYRVASVPDWVIANAGGATNNTLVKIGHFYDPDSTGGTDANLVPLCFHDLTETTNGQQLTVAPTTNQEYFRAS